MPIIKQQKQAFNQPIGVRSFNSGAQQVGQAITNMADTMGKEFYKRAAKKAEKIGLENAQSVASEKLKIFDPETGKPEAMSDLNGMGSIATEAYNRVIDRRFADVVDKDIRLKNQEIASKYPNPAEYENMFQGYLDGLSKNANNKYKNVIVESGSYLMANTRVTLANKARAAARSAAASGIMDSLDEKDDLVHSLALDNNIYGAAVVIEEAVKAVTDGETAGILKKGSTEKTKDALAIQLFNGSMPRIMENATASQQAQINMFIRTLGESGTEGLPESTVDFLDQAQPYLNIDNNNKILSSAKGITNDVNALRNAQISEQEDILTIEAKNFLANFGENSDQMGNFVAHKMAQAIQSTNDKETDYQYGMSQLTATMRLVGNNYETEANNIQSLYDSGLISKEDRNITTRNLREKMITPVILAAASYGNTESLSAALASQDTSKISKLPENQQIIVEELLSSNNKLYSPTEDRTSIGTLIESTRDKHAEITEKSEKFLYLTDTFNYATARFLDNGNATFPKINKLIEQARDALRDDVLTQSQYDSAIQQINISAMKGLINRYSGDLSSTEMRVLTNFFKTNGTNIDAEKYPRVAEIGEEILLLTSQLGDKDAEAKILSSHSNTIREEKQKIEQEEQKIEVEQNLQKLIINGGGDPTNSGHLKMMNKALENLGINISATKSPEAAQLMASVPSSNLIDGLKGIAAGSAMPQSAENLLYYFNILSDYPDGTGVFRNRLSRNLTQTEIAILEDISDINKQTGDSVSNVSIKLFDIRNDSKRKINVETAFGKNKNAEQFISEKMGYGPIIADEFGPVLEYYVGNGMEFDGAVNRIKTKIDATYTYSTEVIDSRFPIAVQGQTNKSLEVVFPDPDRREAFRASINNELNEFGYKLVRDESAVDALKKAYSRTPSLRIVENENDLDDMQSVYLHPYESTAGIAYYAYIIENDTLEPLLIEKDGEVIFPMFDRDNLEDYEKQISASNLIKDEENFQKSIEQNKYERILGELGGDLTSVGDAIEALQESKK